MLMSNAAFPCTLTNPTPRQTQKTPAPRPQPQLARASRPLNARGSQPDPSGALRLGWDSPGWNRPGWNGATMVTREIRGVFGLVVGSLCPCVGGENRGELFRRSETRHSSCFTPFRHFTPGRYYRPRPAADAQSTTDCPAGMHHAATAPHACAGRHCRRARLFPVAPAVAMAS